MLDACIEALLDVGVEGVTLEDVAARSGVAKTTIYRHFGTKQALIAEAAACCVLEHPTPDTGNLQDDLIDLFDRYHRAEDAEHVPNLLPMLIDAGLRDPVLHELVREIIEQRRRPLHTVLQLAQLRGEIGADLDLDAALAVIIGPFTQCRLVDRREVTPEFRDTVLALVVAGLRSTAHAEHDLTPA